MRSVMAPPLGCNQHRHSLLRSVRISPLSKDVKGVTRMVPASDGTFL